MSLLVSVLEGNGPVAEGDRFSVYPRRSSSSRPLIVQRTVVLRFESRKIGHCATRKPGAEIGHSVA